jgi:hypothetical protein
MNKKDNAREAERAFTKRYVPLLLRPALTAGGQFLWVQGKMPGECGSLSCIESPKGRGQEA